MSDFIADGQPFETPLAAADAGYAQLNPGLGPFLGAEAGGGVTAFLARAAERGAQGDASTLDQALAQYQGGGDAEAQAFGFAGGPEPPQPSPMLSTDEANQRFAPIGADGKPVAITSQPISEGLARIIGQQKADALARDSVIARYDANHGALTDFAAGAIGSLLDPANAAAMFVPPLGEGAMLGQLARAGITGFAGRTLARAGAGALTGGLMQLPEAGIKAALAPEEATDYGIGDAMREIAFGAAGFAAMHAGAGALGEGVRALRGGDRGVGGSAPSETIKVAPETLSAATNRDAMASATAQLVDGRPVDVAPLVDPASAPETTLADVAASQRRVYDDGFAPGVPEAEFAATQEAVYAPKETPQAAPGKAAEAQIAPAPSARPEGEGAPVAPAPVAAGAEAAPTARKPARGPALGPRVSRPPDIVQFLAQHGGLEPSGELRAMDAHQKFVPGAGMLVRREGGGMAPDRARELAQEAGYLPADNPHAPSQSTISDLYDAIDATLRGNPRYSDNDAGQVLDHQDYQRRLAEARLSPEERAAAIADQQAGHTADLARAAKEMGVTLTDQEAEHAAALIGEGHEPEAAIDAALERGGMQQQADVAKGDETSEDIPYDDEPATSGQERPELAPGAGPEAARGDGGATEPARADGGGDRAGRGQSRGDAQAHERQDPELARAEAAFAASPSHLLDDADRVELARSETALKTADDTASAAEAAGQCLAGKLP